LFKGVANSVTIVGAGPAGLNAAIQLASRGLRTTLIDENPNIGGAIFRQSSRKLKQPFKEDKTKKRARLLFREFEKHRDLITLLLGTQVLGNIDDEDTLALLTNDRLYSLTPNRLILTTGCHERAQPFPGWTLPGVMTVGGAQLQAKMGYVKPGKQIVLVGTGPLLLVAAKQLHQAGVKVLGVFEAGRRIDLLKQCRSLLSNVALLREGMSLITYMKMAGIPLRYGWGIVNAGGKEELNEVVVAPYDSNWRPIKNQAISIQTDSLGVEYGFTSRTQLTQLLGCKHEYVSDTGGLRPLTDEWQRSSRERVYVAGDSAGVYGSEVATEQGKLAAITCLLDEKVIDQNEATKLAKPFRNRISQLITFRSAFDHFSSLKPGLMELPKSDTIICRCENVERKEIDEAISRGVHDMTSLKMATRIGMGDCQGKLCSSFCTEYLMSKTKKSHRDVGALHPRFPLSPIPFAAVQVKKEGV